MEPDLPITLEEKFSKEAISLQLQKIFLDPFFMNSDILRRFLTFIVDQTLSDNANCLKEYTIGINVLNKSKDFKPQDNGIVRIHAGRLRRALHHYYNNVGAFDPIQIFIPKGRYVPVFIENENHSANNKLSDVAAIVVDPSSSVLLKKQEIIAVLPFQRFHDDPVENSLVDGIGLQLSDALMQFNSYSIVAYYTMRDLWQKTAGISNLTSVVDVNYIISGSIQTTGNRIRSHIQIINPHTGIQLWSCMYEGEFATENIFKLQDEIVQFFISELIKSHKLVDDRVQRAPSLVAVA
jgi:TolB-like protein